MWVDGAGRLVDVVILSELPRYYGLFTFNMFITAFSEILVMPHTCLHTCHVQNTYENTAENRSPYSFHPKYICFRAQY